MKLEAGTRRQRGLDSRHPVRDHGQTTTDIFDRFGDDPAQIAFGEVVKAQTLRGSARRLRRAAAISSCSGSSAGGRRRVARISQRGPTGRRRLREERRTRSASVTARYQRRLSWLRDTCLPMLSCVTPRACSRPISSVTPGWSATVEPRGPEGPAAWSTERLALPRASLAGALARALAGLRTSGLLGLLGTLGPTGAALGRLCYRHRQPGRGQCPSARSFRLGWPVPPIRLRSTMRGRRDPSRHGLSCFITTSPSAHGRNFKGSTEVSSSPRRDYTQEGI